MNIEKLEARYPDGFEQRFVLTTEVKETFSGFSKRYCKDSRTTSMPQLVSEGVEDGDVDSFIDTGSYIFNAF